MMYEFVQSILINKFEFDEKQDRDELKKLQTIKKYVMVGDNIN